MALSARSVSPGDAALNASVAALPERLLPEFLQCQIWRALLELNAAEQGARMVAMDNLRGSCV